MPFITDADYAVLIKADILAQLLRGQASIRPTAERTAQSQIESYLRHKFEVAQIFNKMGDDRAADLVIYMTDIALYHIHTAAAPQQIPDLRVKRYDDAIKWLEMVASGKLSPDLPVIKVEETLTGGISWGSQERVNNYY